MGSHAPIRDEGGLEADRRAGPPVDAPTLAPGSGDGSGEVGRVRVRRLVPTAPHVGDT